MAGEGRRWYQRMMGELLEFLTHSERNAAIIQLAADERQLEMEVLMGRLSKEELQQRIDALTERANALRKGERHGG